MAPMWGFWWIVPLVGFLICLVFIVAAARLVGGHGFMCMADHRSHASDETDLRREVRELRAELTQLKQLGETR
jgi:hypothetical protein